MQQRRFGCHSDRQLRPRGRGGLAPACLAWGGGSARDGPLPTPRRGVEGGSPVLPSACRSRPHQTPRWAAPLGGPGADPGRPPLPLPAAWPHRPSLAERPEGTRLLAAVRPGDAIVAAKLFLTIATAFAEAERAHIRDRVSQTKRDQRQRGRYLGGKMPFGFRLGRGRRTGARPGAAGGHPPRRGTARRRRPVADDPGGAGGGVGRPGESGRPRPGGAGGRGVTRGQALGTDPPAPPRLFRADTGLPRQRAPFRMFASHLRGKLLDRAAADLVAMFRQALARDRRTERRTSRFMRAPHARYSIKRLKVEVG
jgi:hypothetical protein